MIIVIDDKIRLELLEEKHAQQLFEIASVNRRYLREWLPWVDNMQSVDFIKNFINGTQQRNKDGTEYAFAIFDNKTLIGRIGVYKIDSQNKIGEIGYWIGENLQGKGIITKSCKELIDYCFNGLNLNRIEIKCGTNNIKSNKIPQQLNFTKEGIIRQGEMVHNKFHDLNFYSYLKGESIKVDH